MKRFMQETTRRLLDEGVLSNKKKLSNACANFRRGKRLTGLATPALEPRPSQYTVHMWDKNVYVAVNRLTLSVTVEAVTIASELDIVGVQSEQICGG